MSRAKITVKPAAAGDVAAAGTWYGQHSPELGAAFYDELEATFERLREQPLMYQVLHKGIRKAALHRFPYAVYCVVEGQAVVVTAVLHLHRDPAEWQRRRR